MHAWVVPRVLRAFVRPTARPPLSTVNEDDARWAGVLGLVLLCSCGQAPKPPSSEAERR